MRSGKRKSRAFINRHPLSEASLTLQGGENRPVFAWPTGLQTGTPARSGGPAGRVHAAAMESPNSSQGGVRWLWPVH